jgi:hypothetical protein
MTQTDLGDSVRVALDPPNRVAHVHVLRADAVTTPAELDAAVAAAYRVALAERRRTPNGAARRERPVARSIRLTVPALTPGSYDRHRVREATRAERASRRGNPGEVTGRSTNDCVAVTLAPASATGRVDADPGWLRTATSTSISRAVTEAFAAAYAERDR